MKYVQNQLLYVIVGYTKNENAKVPKPFQLITEQTGYH